MSTIDSKAFIYNDSDHLARVGESSRSHRDQGPTFPHFDQDANKRAMEDDDEMDAEGETSSATDGKAKKHKFTRSRTACLQCRSRKSKCGALPPAPCPNCIEANLPCQWPAEDGRSSRARRHRGRSSLVGRKESEEPMQIMPSINHVGDGGQVDDLWLDQLLTAGSHNHIPTPIAPSPHLPQFDFAAPLPPAQQTFDQSSGHTQLLAPTPSFSDFGNTPTSGVDPAQFVWAFSSRLPTVEESSPFNEGSCKSDPSPVDMVMGQGDSRRLSKSAKGKEAESKIVKITWWRPHGQTAIAPGLKKITLKVRVNTPQHLTFPLSNTPTANGASTPEVIGADGMPAPSIMRHLLDVFMIHFGSQFPALDKPGLEAKIEAGTGSVFLLNAIAGIAARFSTHPAIAIPGIEPYAYGNIFVNHAKALLGSMLAVPSRETVSAFVMLAHTGFANDSESEVWMMTGLAVRMSIDLGLHLNPPEESNISADERRLNRLTFWSVLLMDYAISFGVGRQTAFRTEDISQVLPTEDDLSPASGAEEAIRHPFPFAAMLMFSYGPLVNMLNRGEGGADSEEILTARASSMREYNMLPPDMQWNVGNLQRHSRAHQGSAFLHLHLWMHTILASGYLTGTHVLRRTVMAGTMSGVATPNTATASNLWRNSARTIGDILVLSDIIDPFAYFALPFVNQAFFVAGCCYVKEIESTRSLPGSPRAPIHPIPDRHSYASGVPDGKHPDLSRALLTSVATTNISTLQQGLVKQNTYWEGTAWISSALKQRIEGIQDVDLVGVTEKLASFVSLPDAGLVGEGGGRGKGLSGGLTPMKNGGWGSLVGTPFGGGNLGGMGGCVPFDFGDMDFLSLPFDLGTVEGGAQNVIEQAVPLPQSMDSDWFR